MLVSELDIPFVKDAYIRTEQKEETFATRKETWIGKNNVGYVLFRNKDINAFLRDGRWHTAIGLLAELNPNLTPELKLRRKNGLMASNGDDHLRLKRLITPSFTSARSDLIRPFMKNLMKELIQKFSNQEEIDLQKDIFNYYPIPILCKLFGIPDYDIELFSDWSSVLFDIFNLNGNIDQEKLASVQHSFDQYTNELIESKRKNLTDDLLSSLIKAEEDGDKLSNDELVMLIQVIVASGIDTTKCQLGLLTKTLLQNNLLNKNLDGYLEEVIRHDSVLRGTARIASVDIEYNGVTFPKGTFVYLNLVSANFDNDCFTDPLSIIENRKDINKSLSFGAGLHYCLGYALAKAEIEEGIKALSEEIGDRILSWESSNLPATSVLNGLESLKVKLNANIHAIS
jgi:cytochrome P450